MARLPRLSVAGHAHLILLRGHNREPVFRDDGDRLAFLDALRTALTRDRVALHGYALSRDGVWLLCTPIRGSDLSRAMQSLGRRFSAAFNRKHDRSGSLWDGRYRATVVEPGSALLEAMVFVDQVLTDPSGPEASAADPLFWSSAQHHLGSDGPLSLTDTAEYWALGNTPFDRATAYRARLADGLSIQAKERLVNAVLRAWPLGSREFVEELQKSTPRPLTPRPRGRPRLER
jgi:putative transposase